MTSTPQPMLPPPGSMPFIKTRDNAPACWTNDILWLILAEVARVLNSYTPASWEAAVAMAEPDKSRTIPSSDRIHSD